MVRANRHFIKTGKLDYFSKPWKERERERRLESNRRTYQRRKERLKLQKLNGLEQRTPAQLHSAQVHNRNKIPNPIESYIHKEQGNSVQDRYESTYKLFHPEPNTYNEGSEGDGDRGPYWMNPLVEQERLEREALGITPADYGKSWKAAFRTITGDCPKLGPADHDGASLYLSRIRRAMDQSGWTPGEWNTLHALEKKWEARAEGNDIRIEVVGTYRGNPPKQYREEIARRRARSEMRRR